MLEGLGGDREGAVRVVGRLCVLVWGDCKCVVVAVDLTWVALTTYRADVRGPSHDGESRAMERQGDEGRDPHTV